jgi:hypothetical protein
MFAIKGTKSAFAVMDPTGHFPTAAARATAKQFTETLADIFDTRVPVLLAHAKKSGRFRENVIQAVGIPSSAEMPNGGVKFIVKFGQTCSSCGFGDNGIDVKTFTAGNMLHEAGETIKSIKDGVMGLEFFDINNAPVIPKRGTRRHPVQANTQG